MLNEIYDGKTNIAHPFLFLKIIIHFVMQNNPIELNQGKIIVHTKIYKVSDQQPLLYKKCIGAKEYFVFNPLYNQLLSTVVLSACQQEDVF